MQNSLNNPILIAMSCLLLLPNSALTFGQARTEQHPEEIQEDPWVSEVSCRGNSKKEAQGSIANREFRLCFNFREDKLQPGSTGLPNSSDLTIISYTQAGQGNLSSINVEPANSAQYRGLIVGTATPMGPERSSTLSSIRFFKVNIQVTDEARSALYPLAITITAGTESDRVTFELPILAPNSQSLSLEKKPHASVDCWTGSNCSALELEMRNKLPYKITITNISISSEDLLETKPTGDFLRDIENNSSPSDLNLVLKAKPITLRRVFSGFGTPQVTARIDYKDEYGRPLSTQTTADLQIRPNFLVIALFLILGAVMGTLIRIDLRRLYVAGLITSRQRAIFYLTTFASGILVCLIALFADIKIVVLNNQNSYSAWDPKILFLTALVATVNGLPILYAYLRLPDANKPSSTGTTGSDSTG
jgi:hypothetical protein